MKARVNVFLVMFILSMGCVQQLFAQGNLLVAPIRVVFEGAKQKEDLNLTNIGQDTAVYLISFLQYQMMQDGSFKEILNPDTLSTRSDKYLRIFPRKVTLPPGESQTIRMQFRKPADMKVGEYRSHLYFRAEKEVSALGMNTTEVDSNRMSVSITPVFGISIPVIIRNGNLNYKMSLSDVSLTPKNDTVSALSFSLNRLGNRSSYGNIRVDFIPNSEKSVQVGQANGVGVYTSVDSRKVTMLIANPPSMPLKNGRLVIRYSSTREEGDAELAKTEYKLP